MAVAVSVEAASPFSSDAGVATVALGLAASASSSAISRVSRQSFSATSLSMNCRS